MNEKTFLYSLLETPMGYIDWNDKMFLYEILEGYKSAYTMNKKHKEEYKKEKLKDPDNTLRIKPLTYQNLRLRFKNIMNSESWNE
jgi:hypothetical protein